MKLENQMCSDQSFGSYHTLSEAKIACALISSCKGVYDVTCQEKAGNIHLCPSEQYYSYSKSYNSCIYHKEGKI